MTNLLKVSRDDLLGPLSSVSGIIERRHTLPILSNVLIEVADDFVSLFATDIEIQIISRVPLSPGAEPRAITVGARKLLDILRALPAESEVALQLLDKRVQVKSGKSRFTLQTLPSEDFPKLAAPAGDICTIEIAQKRFKHLLGLVQYAMAHQDIRYYLNGLLVVVDGSELRLVATDGHRLAFVSSELGTSLPRREVILPRKTVVEIAKLLLDSDDPVRIDLSSNQAAFRFGNIEVVSKLVEGKFPDYTRVIPTRHTQQVTIDREVLRQTLMRAAILSNEKFRGVRWIINDGSLRIASSNAEQEEAQEEIEIEYKGDALDIGFNVNYLLDVLNNVFDGTVRCSFADSSSSVLMEFPAESTFKYVVMPMRI